MVLLNNNWNRNFFLPFIFLLIFSSLAYAYIQRADEQDQKLFVNHTAILADDIWALNQNGAKAYLQLAVKTNHFKSLKISIPGTSDFVSVQSEPLTGLPYYLRQIRLIGLKELSHEIVYGDQIIGVLHGEKYVRVIFPLINILIFLLLVTLTGIFIVHQSNTSKSLEQQVDERTRKLQESERRFQELVDLLPEMVIETDLSGNITYANKVAREHLALSPPLDTTINFFHFIAEDNREEAKTHFHNYLHGERSELVEYKIIAPDKKTYPTLIRTSTISSGSKIVGARMIVIDITERRLLNEQLERDQKMKAIGLMAGGVAHDLNNILSGIISYPEFLLLDLDRDSGLRKPLEAIRQSGLDAAEVVSDLLTVARGIAAKKEVVAPNTLIESYLHSTDFKQLQSDYPLINFTTSLDPELHNISCSPIHVRKCLMNLINNGAEAIEGEGTISINTSNHTDALPLATEKRHLTRENFTKIVIHDSGSGITAHDLNHIFEPFYTKKVMGRSGTGLGLAVVWNTMHDHGGTVNVVSNGNGTTFELYFPSVNTEILPDQESKDLKMYKGCGQSVLVIDDEPRQREIAQQLLVSLQYQVVTVPSGERAIEYLRDHTVDLLFLDMIMTPGINGRTTFEQILAIHPQQKAIIVSGFAEDDDVEATLAMGAKAFMPKPYTLEQLASVMHQILRS